MCQGLVGQRSLCGFDSMRNPTITGDSWALHGRTLATTTLGVQVAKTAGSLTMAFSSRLSMRPTEPVQAMLKVTAAVSLEPSSVRRWRLQSLAPLSWTGIKMAR